VYASVQLCKLCIFIVMFMDFIVMYVIFCVFCFIVLFCVLKMCNVLLPPGVNPTAVNKYSKTCLKRNVIVPVFFSPFSQVSVLQRVVF
jgi:hypothetical protein